MFSIFKNYKSGKMIVSEQELWRRLESECTDSSYFDEQGDEHSEIDMRLVNKIEDFLNTMPGCEPDSEHRYHKLDFYGDGIRSLSFSMSVFKPEFITVFQAMLVGEHQPFCILCAIYEDFSSREDTKIGTMAIFNDRLMLSKKLVQKLTIIA